MRTILEFIISALAVLFTAYILPGVTVDGFLAALIVAIVLALVNLTVGMILRIVTFPINFLTLGLISFLISGLMVLLTDKLLDGFTVDGYLWALVFAFLLGIIRSVFGNLASTKK